MIDIMKNLSLLGAMALCLIINTDLKAEYREVKDPAGFFSENAKSEANRRILDIEKRFKHDLVIETFSGVPDDVKKGIDLKNKSDVNRMYHEWAQKQFTNLRVNGVYILLTKEPGHLQIEVGNETQKKIFSLLDRDNLTSLMRTKFNEKQNDKALIEAVNFVYNAMESHPDNRKASAPPVNNQNKPVAAAPRPIENKANENNAEGSPLGGWICVGLLVLVGAWLVIAIFRAMFGGGGATAGGGGYGGGGMAPGYGGGGGGGFFTSLLGGMFGAAAGMYMYNNFFGGNHSGSSAYGADQTGAGDNGSSAQDTGSSGSGGDIDDNSSGGGGGGGDFGNDAGNNAGGGGGWFGGGGDSGGDNGGGGWFGGGDNGGGGDFGGGGGGDFGGGGD